MMNKFFTTLMFGTLVLSDVVLSQVAVPGQSWVHSRTSRRDGAAGARPQMVSECNE